VNLAPQGLAEQLAQDEVGFDEPPVLLQHVGQSVLTGICLSSIKRYRKHLLATLRSQ
jgi:hypothetical protein